MTNAPTMTARDRLDDGWNAVVGRPYSFAAVLIVAVAALVVGIGIGFGVANAASWGSAGLSSITSVGGSEPRQGGR